MEIKKITDLLTEHHNEMRELSKEIKNDSARFILLKKHLDIHHELEEDLLLSLLNENDEIKDESLESQEEHLVLNFLMLDLADFPKDNPRWKVKFHVMEEILLIAFQVLFESLIHTVHTLFLHNILWLFQGQWILFLR